MDLHEIQQLIKFVSKSGANEVELETKDFKIVIKAGSKKRGADSEPTYIPQMPVSAAMPIQQVPVAAAPAPAAVAPAPAADSAPAKQEAPAADDNYITVKSPMIGTFYRSASPEDPPFVNVGDDIAPGKVICIIEAMKLFNEIESEVSGKIVKVLVDNSSPVEYDQPLFLVDPS